MPYTPNILLQVDIFVSSPSDVFAEREVILRVIERLNRLSYIRASFVLKPLLYEREVPPAGGAPAQMIVDQYLREPQESFMLICVMWSRMGTPFVVPETGEAFQSGTEYEFMTAYRKNLEVGTPHILLYRKTVPNPDADPQQLSLVNSFFKRFEGPHADLHGLYQSYSTLNEFEEMVYSHIERVLFRNPPSAITAKSIPTHDIPTIREEDRRLDAAMPRQVTVKRQTEIWVQLCLSDSQGFRDQLPIVTEEGDVISKGDVRNTNLALAYPVDRDTGQIQPLGVKVEFRGRDFACDEPEQLVQVLHGKDSGLIVFRATALHRSPRSLVQITIKSQTADQHWITLGSATLQTQITSGGFQLFARKAWSMISTSLTSEAVGAVDRDEVEKALLLDEEMLYTVIVPYNSKGEQKMYHIDGQKRDGEEYFDAIAPELRRVLLAWDICERLAYFPDETELAIIIAQIIAPVAESYPPYLLAAIIIKRGVRAFCDCEQVNH